MISLYNLIVEQKSVITLLLITCCYLVYAFTLWCLFKNSAKKSFDFSVLGLLITLILNRILYIFLYAEQFSKNYWSIYPYSWKEGDRILFNTKPWIVFAFWRGEWDIRSLLISFLLSIFIVNFFYREHIIRLFNNILKAAISASLVFLILAFYKSMHIGRETQRIWGVSFIDNEGKRHPIQLYIFLVSLLSITVIFILQKHFKLIEKINGFVWGFIFFLTNTVVMYYYGENIPRYIISWNLFLAIFVLTVIVVVLLGQFINYKDIVSIGRRTEKIAGRQKIRKKFGDFSNFI